MILNEFKSGGFPITRHTPIICSIILQDTKTHLQWIVYNRYDLKKIIEKHTVLSLLGIWPGKKEIDGYPLDIKAYSEIPTPPEIHKEIDSAIDIKIIMNHDQLSKIVYKPGPRSMDKVPIESTDIKLYDYVCSAGFKYKTSFE